MKGRAMHDKKIHSLTKRIFAAIFSVSLSLSLLSFFFILYLMYDYDNEKQQGHLRDNAVLLAAALEDAGDPISFLRDIPVSDARFTLIAPDGSVKYDSKTDASQMENHLLREEIQLAIENGIGESARYSSTLTVKTNNCAIRLSDGAFIRVSQDQYTMLSLILDTGQPLAVVLTISLGLSLLLAYRISRSITARLNAWDLHAKAPQPVYSELYPLAQHLETQNIQIERQLDDLTKARKEIQTITKNLPEGLLQCDASGKILSCNRTASALLTAKSGAIPIHVQDLTDQSICALLDSALAGQKTSVRWEKDGCVYRTTAAPIQSGKRICGAVLILIDITDSLRQEELRREFSANVSHELKTPLTVISGYAELMENRLVQQKDLPEFAGRIRKEAGRMIQLIGDIMRLSAMDEGKQKLSLKRIDLAALSAEVCGKLSERAKEMKVRLSCDAPKPVYFICDEGMMTELITNLTDNAIKYNRENGAVRVFVREENGKIVLTVEDSGIGISKVDQSHIFERFYRADKSRSKALGGTGLGLSIVRHIAQLHGGRITLTSAPNRGTTIEIVFPQDAPFSEKSAASDAE